MKITSQSVNASGHISVVTEQGESLELIIVGCDGCGSYAVHWDAGGTWTAGQFVDMEDAAELYGASDDSQFRREDGTELAFNAKQDGGSEWIGAASIRVEVQAVGGWTTHSAHSTWQDAVDQADMVRGRIVVDDLDSLEFIEWSDGEQTYGSIDYREYFNRDGVYLGPDVDGIEPVFA